MSQSSAFDTSQTDFVIRPEERVVIFAAEWHGDIVEMLVNDAAKVLVTHGVRQVEIIKVPGCYELPQAVNMYFYGPLNATLSEPRDRMSYSAICFGCEAIHRILLLFPMQ